MRLSGAAGDTQRARGKLASCQNSVPPPPNIAEKQIRPSVSDYNAQHFVFIFSSVLQRLGAGRGARMSRTNNTGDAGTCQHSKRWHRSGRAALQIKGSTRGNNEDGESCDKGRGGTALFVGLSCAPAMRMRLDEGGAIGTVRFHKNLLRTSIQETMEKHPEALEKRGIK